jgi:hypothetical protein
MIFAVAHQGVGRGMWRDRSECSGACNPMVPWNNAPAFFSPKPCIVRKGLGVELLVFSDFLWCYLLIAFQHGQEGLLGDIDIAHGLHAFLARLLFLKQLSLPGNITTVTFRGDILS